MDGGEAPQRAGEEVPHGVDLPPAASLPELRVAPLAGCLFIPGINPALF